MRQVLFEVPYLGLKIFGYGLMLFFAFIGSMNLAAWRARREKLNPGDRLRPRPLRLHRRPRSVPEAFYVVQYWGTKIQTFWEIFEIWKGGIVLYGSILGGTLAFFLYRLVGSAVPAPADARCRRPFARPGDRDRPVRLLPQRLLLRRYACQPPLGRPVPPPLPGSGRPSSPEGLIAARRRARPSPVHPTQLYSTIDGLMILLLLDRLSTRLRRRDGEVMGLMMLAYPITRFLVEHLRNDEGVWAYGMTISQIDQHRRLRRRARLLDLPQDPAQAGLYADLPRRAAAKTGDGPGPGLIGSSSPGPPALDASGHPDVVEDPGDEVIGGQALGIRLVAGEDPVAEDVAGEDLDVVGGDEVTPREQGMGPRRGDQRPGWREGLAPSSIKGARSRP